MNKIGAYIHIPFCKKKCPYCDFYSAAADDKAFGKYTDAICSRIYEYGRQLKREADTLYFGGGTPGLLGAERLCRIYNSAKDSFGLDNAEVTVEVNPEKKDIDFYKLRKCGFNRLSLGIQSANDNELALLGRLHSVSDAAACIAEAKASGFENISLDLMIATPSQTKESLKRSIEFCVSNGAKHISAYILKIEQGTPYYNMRDSLSLVDEDEQADMYLYACEQLEKNGFSHYEISNFALPGYESRHNLKYWHDEEYIGIGPSAHSFIDGKRFYCERSFDKFYDGTVTPDGEGGSSEEYIMLGLRLSEGITNAGYRARFGSSIPERYITNAKKFNGTGLLYADDSSIRLTSRGFLVSNSLIAEILS